MSAHRPRVCLIEDDEIMGESLSDRFTLEGFDCDWHKSSASAMGCLGKKNYAVAVSDIRLQDFPGNELFSRLKQSGLPLPPFIFITGYSSIDTAVELLKQGAADYITKPFDLDLLMEKIRALSGSPTPQPVTQQSAMLGISAEMRRVAEALPRLAKHASAILITGESGVGKEKVALELHRCDPQSAKNPFIAVNCGAISESLMEAELFGYEKGAFTGATRTRKGVFEQADGGTLFLDEIGDMPLAMQVKLLRAIQERSIVRVGGETTLPVNLRLICATHRDLKQMVEQGLFREDLYYRINVIHLKIPALRERKEDILWFADMFLCRLSEQHAEEKKTIQHAAESAMLEYAWPGNIRELQHVIERACILTSAKTLTTSDLFEGNLPSSVSEGSSELDLSQYLQSCERRYITNTLDLHRWQMGDTAAALGISRKNLWEKMKKLGIKAEQEQAQAGSGIGQ